jgi:hypothetical protein
MIGETVRSRGGTRFCDKDEKEEVPLVGGTDMEGRERVRKVDDHSV